MAFVETFLVSLLNGATWGIAIALIAIGLTLIFGLLEIVNLAHGSFYMLGAVSGWLIWSATGSFLVALVIAAVFVGLLGLVIEYVMIRPIRESPDITMIATFGLMLVFQYSVLFVFGASARGMPAPISFRLQFGSVTYPGYRIVMALVAVVVMGGLYLFLQRTRFGMWMRGVRQDPEMAEAMGIDVSRIFMATFGMGAFFAAFAGVLVAPIVAVQWQMGLDILIIAIVVVIVGGLGSLRGVLVVSLVYGLVNSLSSIALTPLQAQIFALTVLMALIIVKPEGLEEVLG